MALPSPQSRWHGAWRRLGESSQGARAAVGRQLGCFAARAGLAAGFRAGSSEQASLRVFPAAFGCRWCLSEPSPVSCQVWDALAPAPPCHLCVGALILSLYYVGSVLRMSLSKMHGGPSITFCPVCSPLPGGLHPLLGSPASPGKVEQHPVSQARNLPWVLLASPGRTREGGITRAWTRAAAVGFLKEKLSAGPFCTLQVSG